MTNNISQKQSASVTARISPDAMGLGRTSGQRTAEMVAGMRYELEKSDLNNALSRFAGRMAGRMIVSLMRERDQINYILARPATFQYLTKQHVASLTGDVIMVDIAAGFSPRGIQLARELPKVQVIEIDLPDVVEEKQRRLKSANISVPDNLKWYKADLGVEALSDVLEGAKVDLVSAEGLNPYFKHEDIIRIASHVRESLKPGAVYISDIGWEAIQHQTKENASIGLFKRNATTFLGTVKTDEEGQELFLKAGYDPVEIKRPTIITATMDDIPTTPQDYSVIYVAYNPK